METDQRHTKNRKSSPKIPCAQILVERNMAESAHESDPDAVNCMIVIGAKKCACNKNLLFMAAIFDTTFKYAPKGLHKRQNTRTREGKG